MTLTRVRLLAALLLLSALLGVSRISGAEPPKEVRQHPILAHAIDPGRAEDYKQAVRRVMAMSEDEMLKLIPTKSTILFCGCPNCSGGQQESKQFSWTIERPFEVHCRFCGQVYPSDKYPMDKAAQGVNALGETVTYRYYFDEKRGQDCWFEAHADRLRRDWFIQQCQALARVYQATRKPEYTRRAALILDRFAEAYSHMAVLSQWPFRRRQVSKPTPPYPYTAGRDFDLLPVWSDPRGASGQDRGGVPCDVPLRDGG